MPITVRVDKEAGIRFNEVSGDVTLDEILSVLRGLYEKPNFDPNLNVLWDMRDANVGAISFEEAKYISDFAGSHWGTSGRSRAAFVVSRDLHYGVARMFEQLLESRSPNEVMVFRDYDEALSWLTEA
jgi:hypothetical protein